MSVTIRRLPVLAELVKLAPTEFVDRLMKLAQFAREQQSMRLALEAAVSIYARRNWIDYHNLDLQTQLAQHPSTHFLEVPLNRVSVVTACMNRNDHLIRAIPSWLRIRNFSEIIIVDFGSNEAVELSLEKQGLRDHRIRVIRREDTKWCLAEAFNTGFWAASQPYIIKLDADTIIRGNANNSLRLHGNQFKTGNWRTFENNYLNGVVLAPIDAIRKVGGYNEQIRRYGWDDCDFYERLAELALIKSDLHESDFLSIDHNDNARVDNGDEVARTSSIDTLIQGNRIISNLLPKWTDKLVREHDFSELSSKDINRLSKITDLSYQIAETQAKYLYNEDSNYQYSEMLADVHGLITGTIKPQKHSDITGFAVNTINRSRTYCKYVLLTTLYEDKAPVRQHEMIRTLRKNCGRFSSIIILYEATSVSSNIKSLVGEEIKRLKHIGKLDSTSASIEVIEINSRPSYTDFFRLTQERRTNGEEAWYVIANSDIYFDQSLASVELLSNEDDTLLCLSRWDRVIAEEDDKPQYSNYTDEDGVEWSLIQAIAGETPIPNFLSADAWIYKQEPCNWEEYGYKLGTFFCDSFFANRAHQSEHRILNPCLSIRCYHLHSPLHNSSATKFTDKQTINQLYTAEKAKLQGEEPVAGIAWGSVEGCLRGWIDKRPHRWSTNQRVLDLGVGTNAMSAMALIELMLRATEGSMASIFVLITEDPHNSPIINLVNAFVKWLNNDRITLVVFPGQTRQIAISRVSRELRSAISNARSSGSLSSLIKGLEAHHQPVTAADLNDLMHLDLMIIAQAHQFYCFNFINNNGPYPWMTHVIEESRQAHTIYNCFGRLGTGSKPRFSLFASLFKAANFLPRMLENFEAIASLGPCELILVDVTPNESDKVIIQNFIESSNYSAQINYHHLENDPGIYACWMKAIELAQSELVSNFNADDRRSAIHPHLLAEFLHEMPEVDVAFTALKPTYVANRSWYEGCEEACWFTWFEQGTIFNKEDFIAQRDGIYSSQNIAHCMPMWRKALHQDIGSIREDLYGTSADWAFWLECMRQGKKLALADNRSWGLYYINPSSHNRINDKQGLLENKIIQEYYGLEQTRFVQQ